MIQQTLRDQLKAQAKPQVPGQIEPGNIDLLHRPRVKNADGSISTVRSVSFDFDGQEVLLPTVSEDGRIMSDDEAVAQYKATGRHLGKFKTPQDADAYAQQLHKDQEKLIQEPPQSVAQPELTNKPAADAKVDLQTGPSLRDSLKAQGAKPLTLRDQLKAAPAAVPAAAPEPPEVELDDMFKSAATSVARGAVDATGKVLSGMGRAAVALDKLNPFTEQLTPQTSGLMKAGEAVSRFGQETFPANPAIEHSGKVSKFVSQTLPEFAGGIAPMVAAGATGGGVAAAGLGAVQQGASGYYDAIGHGASEEDAMKSYLLNLGVGALQAFPVARYFGQLGKVEQSMLRRVLVESALASGSFAGAQAAANTIANSLVGYDPNRPTSQGVGEAALLGGIAGGAGAALQPRGAVEPTAPKAKGEIPLLPPQEPLAAPEAPAPLQSHPEGAIANPLSQEAPQATPQPDAAQGLPGAPEQAPTPAAQGVAAPGGEAAAPVSAPEGTPPFPAGPIGDAAKTAFAEGEATEIGTKPSPIASTMEDPTARALQRGVREVRSQDYEPIPIEQQRQQAESRLAADRPAEEKAVFDKIARGDALNPVETHIADIAQSDAVMGGLRSGDTASLADAVAKNWAYQDARAVAGRTLGTIRDALRTPKEHLADVIATPDRATREKLEKIKTELDSESTTPERKKFLKDEVKKLADLEGQKLADVRKALVEAGLDPALADDGYFKDLTSYARIARIVSTKKSTAWDWALEARISNLVSGPLSQKANIVGNTANMLYDQHLRRFAAGMIGSALGRTDTATLGEVGAFYAHSLGNLIKAGRYLTLAYKHEVPIFEVDLHRKGVPVNLAGGAKEDIMSGPKIPGVLGRVIRAPGSTSLLAFDEFAKQLIYGPEAAALAYRAAKKEGLKGDALHARMGEILADYKHPIHLESFGVAKKLVFQDPGGPLIKHAMLMRGALNNLFGSGVPVGSLVFPFLKTGVLIFKTGLGIPLRPLITLDNIRKGTYKGNPALAVDDAARTLLSIAATAAIVGLVSQDDADGVPSITGTAARDPNERSAQYRTAPPYSVKIGGQWHDYRRIEPAAVAVATVVDIAHEFKHNPNPEVLGKLLNSVVDQMTDKTFLRTIGDIIEAVRDSDNKLALPNIVRDTLVTPLIPNVIRQPLRESDPYFRQNPARKHGDDGRWWPWQESFGALRYLSWPSAGNAPPIKYDLWGRPMTRAYPQSKPVNRFLLELAAPIQEAAGGKDPSRYDLMILRYNDKVRAEKLKDADARVFYPAPPEYAYMDKGKRVWWTDEEYARVQQISGEFTLKVLNKVKALNVKDPGVRDMDILGDVITEARKFAKFTVLREKANSK